MPFAAAWRASSYRSSSRTDDAVLGKAFSLLVRTFFFCLNAASVVAAWRVVPVSASLYFLCFSARTGDAIHGKALGHVVGPSSL